MPGNSQRFELISLISHKPMSRIALNTLGDKIEGFAPAPGVAEKIWSNQSSSFRRVADSPIQRVYSGRFVFSPAHPRGLCVQQSALGACWFLSVFLWFYWTGALQSEALCPVGRPISTAGLRELVAYARTLAVCRRNCGAFRRQPGHDLQMDRTEKDAGA